MAEVNIQAELDRKAADALGAILSDYNNGLISNGEARTALRTAFACVSGLVAEDVFDLFSAASAMLKEEAEPTILKRLYAAAGRVVQVELELGGETVVMKRRDEGSDEWNEVRALSFGKEPIPFEAAKDGFNALCVKLGKQMKELK